MLPYRTFQPPLVTPIDLLNSLVAADIVRGRVRVGGLAIAPVAYNSQ